MPQPRCRWCGAAPATSSYACSRSASIRSSRATRARRRQSRSSSRIRRPTTRSASKPRPRSPALAKQPAAAAAFKAFDAAKQKAGDDNAALKKARDAFKQGVAEYKGLDSAAKSYASFARTIQSHAARIEVAVRCKDDLACFAATLSLTPAAELANIAPYIADVASWPEEDKRDLVAAAIERGMLELAKRGATAAPFTDALLAAALSDVRLIRQSILLALPAIAPRPCDACEAGLDKALAAGEGKTALGDLQLETELVRNYFTWAGRKP